MNGPMAQPHKGERDQFSTRPPIEVGRILRQKAEAAGVPYGEYIASVLCEYAGLSYLLPIPQPKGQDQLPTEGGYRYDEKHDGFLPLTA